MADPIQLRDQPDVERRPARLSVVIPAFEEGGRIALTVETVARVLAETGLAHEIIVVDDGSRDETYLRLQALGPACPSLRAIRLSRNFGKEAALLAGLRASLGDAVITLDADLQHPPGLIPEMVRRWLAGARIVHAVKHDRSRDSGVARLRAALFNRLMERLSGVDLAGASDFKLLDRSVVDVLVRDLRERQRFYRGLAGWVGYRQEKVGFSVGERDGDRSRFTLRTLLDLATTALVSFSSAPLRLVTLLGLATLLLGVTVGGEALWSWLQGEAVSGFATIELTLLILGSFIMISLGLMGEYVGRIYDEIKGRPSYLIESTCGFGEAGEHGADAFTERPLGVSGQGGPFPEGPPAVGGVAP